jgi:hypothetical protein
VQDHEFEQQLRRQDVQLLVTQLMKNEETTIKLILERLYDTATVNWIDQKVQFPFARGGLKFAARCAKPAGRYFGYRWLVKKTPRLITGWLFRQVAFKPKQAKSETVEVKAIPEQLFIHQQQQINQLQNRLRLTSGIAVISIVSVGGLLWMQGAAVFTQIPQTTPVSQNQIGQ